MGSRRPASAGTAISDTVELPDRLDRSARGGIRTPRAGAMFSQPDFACKRNVASWPWSADQPPHTPPSIWAGRSQHQSCFRSVDPVKESSAVTVAGVPAVAVTLDQQVQFARANTDFVRDFDVHLRSADEKPRTFASRSHCRPR